MSKNKKKLMKIVNTDRENLYIFWTTWMKLSENMWLIIILIMKVPKKQGFALSLEETFLEDWDPSPPHPHFF